MWNRSSPWKVTQIAYNMPGLPTHVTCRMRTGLWGCSSWLTCHFCSPGRMLSKGVLWVWSWKQNRIKAGTKQWSELNTQQGDLEIFSREMSLIFSNDKELAKPGHTMLTVVILFCKRMSGHSLLFLLSHVNRQNNFQRKICFGLTKLHHNTTYSLGILPFPQRQLLCS